jgi:hypothetical protein
MPDLSARVLAKELGEAVDEGTSHVVKRNSHRTTVQSLKIDEGD